MGAGAYAMDGGLEPGQAAKAHVGCATGVPGVAVVWAPQHNVLRYGGLHLAGPPRPASDHAVYPGHKAGIAAPVAVGVRPLSPPDLAEALKDVLPLPTAVPDATATPSWLHAAAGPGVARAAKENPRQSLRDNMRRVEMQDAVGRLVALKAVGECAGPSGAAGSAT